MFKLFISISLLISISFADVINKKYFTIEYNNDYKGATKVFYRLDSKVNKDNIKKRGRFYTEKEVSSKYRTYYSDYTNTGMDRGHLAPDASFDWSIDSRDATYSMANIVPQYPSVNQKVWLAVEELERYNASQFGIINVVNFVHYDDVNYLTKESPYLSAKKYEKRKSFKSEQHRKNYIKSKKKAKAKLAKKKIRIPSGFSKVMYTNDKSFKECFYVPNKPNLTISNVKDYQVDCTKFF